MKVKYKKLPRVMIAGISSGSGKTTVACGILQALKNRGIKVSASKCGPDYIDPMFHSKVIGIPSHNIDLFFTTPSCAATLLARNGEGTAFTLIEGVMGYYDGMEMASTKASSYDVAVATKTPVVLVVPCKGMALSVVPLIQGMKQFRENSYIEGVVLNGVSKGTYLALKPIIEEQVPVKVFGYLPEMADLKLESRHLGLVMPEEIAGFNEQLQHLSQIIEETIQLDELLALGGSAPHLVMTSDLEEIDKRQGNDEKIKIGIAYDPAFCFYYKDNLEVLKALGCEMVYFSPLKDEKVPEGISGLLLGGGYPELYGQQLEANEPMRRSIRAHIKAGMPCLAECGGFMYLHEKIEGTDGQFYAMAGVLQAVAENKKHLVRFGYIQLEQQQANPFLKQGETIAGHEFHHWDSTDNGKSLLAKRPSGKGQWDCMVTSENLMAGYPHLYYYSNLKVPERFVTLCRHFKKREQ